jgi:hypothetical protein
VGAGVAEPADVICGGDVVSCNNDGGCCCCCCDGAVLDGRLPFSELCAAKIQIHTMWIYNTATADTNFKVQLFNLLTFHCISSIFFT